MKLIIGNKNYSSWSLRAWLLLTEHGISFEEIRIPLCQADTKRKLLAYSDTGLVPVLHDGDLIVWDSLAICEYISETYLDGRGWPTTNPARAQARACAAEMHAGFTNLRQRMPMNCRARNRKVEVNSAIQTELTRIEQIFNQNRTTYQANGPWLFGVFSIADCFFAPIILRLQTYGITLSPAAEQYAQHVIHSPALQQWLAAAKAEQEIIAEDEVGQ